MGCGAGEFTYIISAIKGRDGGGLTYEGGSPDEERNGGIPAQGDLGSTLTGLGREEAPEINSRFMAYVDRGMLISFIEKTNKTGLWSSSV